MGLRAVKEKSKGKNKKQAKASRWTAATADRHVLYQHSVQCVEAEIDFVDDTFEKLRGRRAKRLREDFCGTGNTSCEWVRRRNDNEAVGVDFDAETLGWGMQHNVSQLSEQQRGRVRLTEGNVLTTPEDGFDVVLAMNFSFWCFKTRAEMLAYFKHAYEGLKDDGILFTDFYGGPDAYQELEEEREIDDEDFTYVWDQAAFNPITNEVKCAIHFQFEDGTEMRNAFTYEWRVWSLPEIREVLEEAGFRKTTVYWEGDDGEGGGNGEFTASEEGDACDSFICYITAEK